MPISFVRTCQPAFRTRSGIHDPPQKSGAAILRHAQFPRRTRSSHCAATQTASCPRSHSPGARPIASWHDRILPLFWKIIFLFPGHRSPALRTFSIHAGNSAFMRFPVSALRAYAVTCWSCRTGSTHTTGFSASLTLPHSAARSHSPGSCSVSSWHDRILPLFLKIIFLFPGRRSPTLRRFPIRAGNSVYAVPCARTAGLRSRLLGLPHGVRPHALVFGFPNFAPFRRPLLFLGPVPSPLGIRSPPPIPSPTNRHLLNLLVDDHFRDSTPLV